MAHGYITASEIIAELQSEAVFKDNPQILDKPSIYRWIQWSLQEFGRNVMTKESIVVDIENYRGRVPEGFGQLSLAVYCQGNSCVIKGEPEEAAQTAIYTSKVTTSEYFSSVSSCSNGGDCKPDCTVETTVKEEIKLSDTCSLDLYYNPIGYVKLGRGVLDGGCTDDCINRNIKSPYGIDIKGNMIFSTFKSGSVYMEYYKLPEDEEGVPIIPKTQNGYLERYIYEVVRRKTLNAGMWSNDIRDKQYLYAEAKADETYLFAKAKQDVSRISMMTLYKYAGELATQKSRYTVNMGKDVLSTYRQ